MGFSTVYQLKQELGNNWLYSRYETFDIHQLEAEYVNLKFMLAANTVNTWANWGEHYLEILKDKIAEIHLLIEDELLGE